MSVAEIQDNKWEVQAAKPPLLTAGSIGAMIMMGGFALFFVWVIIFSVIGSFTETKEMDFSKTQKAEADAAAAAE
jgi:hypothetical protein